MTSCGLPESPTLGQASSRKGEGAASCARPVPAEAQELCCAPAQAGPSPGRGCWDARLSGAQAWPSKSRAPSLYAKWSPHSSPRLVPTLCLDGILVPLPFQSRPGGVPRRPRIERDDPGSLASVGQWSRLAVSYSARSGRWLTRRPVLWPVPGGELGSVPPGPVLRLRLPAGPDAAWAAAAAAAPAAAPARLQRGPALPGGRGPALLAPPPPPPPAPHPESWAAPPAPPLARPPRPRSREMSRPAPTPTARRPSSIRPEFPALARPFSRSGHSVWAPYTTGGEPGPAPPGAKVSPSLNQHRAGDTGVSF